MSSLWFRTSVAARRQFQQSDSIRTLRPGANARDGTFGVSTTNEKPCNRRHHCCYGWPGRKEGQRITTAKIFYEKDKMKFAINLQATAKKEKKKEGNSSLWQQFFYAKSYKLEFNWEKKGMDLDVWMEWNLKRAFGHLKLYQSKSSCFDWSCQRQWSRLQVLIGQTIGAVCDVTHERRRIKWNSKKFG